MKRQKFVNGDVHRIDISDGDWIEVKKDLNTGDQKRLEAAGNGVPIKLADGSMYTPIDWSIYEIDRAAIFLTAWSLQDGNGQPVKLERAAICALEPMDFEEINTTIFKWVMARAAEKNALRASLALKKLGEPVPEVTSA